MPLIVSQFLHTTVEQNENLSGQNLILRAELTRNGVVNMGEIAECFPVVKPPFKEVVI